MNLNKLSTLHPSPMNRRTFFTATTLVATGLIAGASDHDAIKPQNEEAPSGQKSYSNERPNILVITTDQQWAGAMSCAGNPWLHTPAIDSLAQYGVQFELAYTPNPICVPARTSYMTGTASHENGVFANMRANQVDLPTPCLAKLFQDNGYDTGYVGKWHLPRPIRNRKWSGFNYLASLRNNRVDFDIPKSCEAFIRKERKIPFFLIASFVNPHDICEWARLHSGIERWSRWGEFPNGEIGDPPPPEECPPFRANNAIPQGEPSEIRKHQSDDGMQRVYPTRHWGLQDGRWRQYLWAYYRMTELVDNYIGQVLEVLRQSGQLDNTVIVFTSDHGDGIGSHHWNQKTIFYDEISRVPFIVSWKGHTRPCGRNRKHLVNVGLDLFPTLFDFAGIEKPARLRGLSAAPFACGHDDTQSHPYIVVENNHHSGFGNPTDVHGRMLRSGRYKYVRYNKGQPAEQLFDMELDPGETNDLTLDPKARKTLDKHRQMLNEYIVKTDDVFPLFKG